MNYIRICVLCSFYSAAKETFFVAQFLRVIAGTSSNIANERKENKKNLTSVMKNKIEHYWKQTLLEQYHQHLAMELFEQLQLNADTIPSAQPHHLFLCILHEII